MKIAWLIVGLPGSGKTYMVEELRKAVDGVAIVDEPATLHDVDLTQEWLVIADPRLCNEDALEECIKMLTEADYDVSAIFYFANDPDQCIANVRFRGDGDDAEETIRFMSRHYNPPPELTRPVWKGVIL